MPKLTLLLVLIVVSQCAETESATIDFVTDIRPIFQKHCYSCHGAEKQQSDLRLDIKTDSIIGGEEWSLVKPGSAIKSPLFERITSQDDDLRMPPEGDSLSNAEIEKLKRWIDEGASWPDGVDLATTDDRRDHWSFHPISKSNLDQSIDDFLDEALRANGLTRNPPASESTFVRRLYFDVTGLPPLPEDVAAYVANPDTAQLVDQLLASPRYGERWAQHWLDVIRWAETVGFETNAERRHAWPYRDWVITAFNEDKPYDRFIFEQLAGDTVGADAALGFLVAGPANLPGQIGRDEAAMRNARQDELDEVIGTVSQAFLGLTVGCARCHDHKFDPILQRDYYSMQAIFAGLSYGTRRLRGQLNDEWTRRLPKAEQTVADLKHETASLRKRYGLRAALANEHEERFAPVVAKSIRMRIKHTTNGSPASLYEFQAWTKQSTPDNAPRNAALASEGSKITASSFALANQSRHFDNLIDGSIDKRQAYPWVAAASGPAWFRIDFASPVTIDRVTLHIGSSMPADFVIETLTVDSEEWVEVAHTRDRFPREDDIRPIGKLSIESLSDDDVEQIRGALAKLRSATSERARLAAGPQVYAASFTPSPEPTFLLSRGDAMRRRQQVAPQVPVFLGSLETNEHTPDVERRIALANWLTKDEHPLTARVIVNRVWQHHFGTGIVDTPSDFGRMGTTPSHPELLDWLAAKFVADGWSLKKLHRAILTSAAYRQSSAPRPDGMAIDAESRLLWRYPPRRLEAEAIRDSILSISGNLNLESGGPGFDFFNQRGGLSDYQPKLQFDESGWRRMIYAHKVRMISVDVFGVFDCPDAGQMKPRRTRSITPVQSLGLLNSHFVNEQAQIFAKRIRTEAGSKPLAQIKRCFDLAYSRAPTDPELRKLSALAEAHGLDQVCRAIFNTSEFIYIR